jgi:hypothetical protein
MPMKPSVLATAMGVLALLACSKSDPSGPAPSASAASAPANVPPTATAPATTAAPAAPAAPAFVQKGIPAGKVVVGYIQDGKDPDQCAAVTDVPGKKDEFTKDGDKVAQMMKGKVVPACPTTSVVGTCNAGMGMLVNYSGPKWTADTAKKDCLAHPYQKWVD